MSTILAASTACQESRLGTTWGKGYYSPNVRVDDLPWSDVFSILTSPWGCIIKRGMLDFLSLRTRLCTAARDYYWSKQNKTDKPFDEPPTDQEHRPEVRIDQAHRAQLIARSIISSGCVSLVKSVFGFVVFFFFFFVSLIIADGPHHYHPTCGHKGSSHLSPVRALQFFYPMQVQHSYNSSTNG